MNVFEIIKRSVGRCSEVYVRNTNIVIWAQAVRESAWRGNLRVRAQMVDASIGSDMNSFFDFGVFHLCALQVSFHLSFFCRS